MNKHKPVSRLHWQASLKIILKKWRTKDLNRERQRVEKAILPIIKSYAEQYSDDGAVLEIGCGPVCISRLLGMQKKTYLDPLIDNFRRLFPGKLPEKAEYLSSMAERIAKPNESYDLIICLNTLSHVLNPELIMHEVERLLKPDGTLIISIRTHSPIEARLHYWTLQTCPALCSKTRPYYYSLIGIERTLNRHFNITDAHQLKTRSNWIPFFKRERHLFVCSRQDKATGSANPA